MKRTFASDNFSGVLPEVLTAIKRLNIGHVPAYGYDKITNTAISKFQQLFDDKVDVYFVFNGTAANILGISSIIESYHSIICANTSHINTDECGAIEKNIGSKVIAIDTKDGKLIVNDLKKLFAQIRFNSEHQSQPKVISITQSTEYGTVYTPEEIKDLVDFAHSHNLYLHMDGARIANAVAYLEVEIKDITSRIGVDILTFGGTKNGMMYGEAVIIFNKNLSKKVKYLRKQHLQLASKMRFISAQFNELLLNDLWLKTASKKNKLANLLAEELHKIPQIEITQNVESNMVFAIFPMEIIPSLQKEFYFHIWNTTKKEIRLVCSFDNTREDVFNFVALIKKLLQY